MADTTRPQGYWRIPELLPALSPEVHSALESFYSDIIRFNLKLELIPRKNELDSDISQFYDCIRACQILLESTKSKAIYDINSGNGLPAIIISLLDPLRTVTVIEGHDKRADFISFSAKRMNLKNISVQCKKIEDVTGAEIMCAVTRSPSRVTKNILATRSAFKVGGEYYHFRGSNWVREIAEIPSQICTVWSPRLVKEYDLPVISTRQAVICTKRI